MRKTLTLGLPLSAIAILPAAVAHAQSGRIPSYSSSIAPIVPRTPESRPAPVTWSAPQSQTNPNLRMVQMDIPSTPRVNTPPPVANNGPATDPNKPVMPRRGRKPIVFTTDFRTGFDKTRIILFNPGPVAVDVKRSIRTLTVAGEYEIGRNRRVRLIIPYIDQTTKNSANGLSFRQRGRGLGDISLWLEQSFPNYKKGHEFSVAGGMIFPTGKKPFNLPDDRLSTGLGFYQPVVRLSARSLRAPLQFFGSVDYSAKVSRNEGGQRFELPASYGGEFGFFYTLGPQWATQTSVSVGKASSPLLQTSGSTVGYLTQALSYRTGDRASLRGSVDVGLTDDSTDAYFGLSYNSSF